jgi:hypothetical protein
LVQLKGGVLVLDGSTLDKLYARSMELVTRHWSEKNKNDRFRETLDAAQA